MENLEKIQTALNVAITALASAYPQDFEAAFGRDTLEELLNKTEHLQEERLENILKEGYLALGRVQFKPGAQVRIKHTGEIDTIEAIVEGMCPPITLVKSTALYFHHDLDPA